ncbi:acid phosphatase type 7 isoform X1 [Danaus plexippus]|uniref:acid phosphatase type 7 isoform X1 n=1 Tax=Danaus plexippus TaxID=13037 RepID=UPI002AAF5CEA|nr:acid phosphatase type 7 isoform X1 [Danaus plexippus]
MKLLIFVVVITLSKANKTPRVSPGYDCDYCQPEQIHISFGSKTNDIVVTWTTFNDTQESRVQYGVGVMDQEAVGSSTVFTDGGRRKRTMWIHRVLLKDLNFNTRYVYHAGSVYGWSEQLSFKTPPQGEDWVVRAAVYGDMGSKNAHSLSYLQDEAERGHFDLILHVGDFAYDMDTDDALVGDEFMRQIQPLAAGLPYMTCPGNHESKYNFSNYRNRFSMPGDSESMFYSFDLGPVHFVSISTEFYYFLNYGFKMVANQFYWLEEDLRKANEPENRRARPWLVMFGHRPMYCSNSDDVDCSVEYTRKGLPFLGLYSLEPLLKEYHVDLVVWAHEHSYERSWPLYDGRVYNGTEGAYVNPRAPVHVVTGSAGCQEDTDKFQRVPPEWSAFRSSDYGYTRLAADRTAIHIQQVDVDLRGQVIDSFTIVKDRHVPFDV